ncbi:MAG: 3,4-dihydroxy-2-butanone-4-phosphate synthase [Proteobacteria bacterium]|nr:3,4-dihydroxy-2-butanone-4-phosphate synthase [Pseudomonadota bacterium]
MVDDEDRENEGDLVLAAECVSPQAVNFMAKEARGLICLTLEASIVEHLKLPMMADGSKRLPDQGTAFTVSIEARRGVSTGISAADRAHTIKVAIDNDVNPDDIVVPGHIFPLRARAGGVLERAGHTEGSVDLAKLAGLKGAGVICEIMNDDGTMARMPDLEIFAAQHKMPIVAIADLIQYRLLHESMVEELGRDSIKTSSGICEAVIYRNTVDGLEHLALVKGQDFDQHIVDVRVHAQHPLIDVFADRHNGSGYRLQGGLDLLASHDRAVLIYLSHSHSSWMDELKQLSTDRQVSAQPFNANKKMDQRLHGTGAQIIRALGVQRMRVHTSSPMVLKGLSGFGLEIVENPIIPKSL